MTQPAEIPSVTYVGNGTTTIFPFVFYMGSGEDVVSVTDVATGVETPLADAAYVIAGLDDPDGGTVTYNPSGVPITSATTITIKRRTPLSQELDLPDYSKYNASSLMGGLNRIVRQIQEIDARVETVEGLLSDGDLVAILAEMEALADAIGAGISLTAGQIAVAGIASAEKASIALLDTALIVDSTDSLLKKWTGKTFLERGFATSEDFSLATIFNTCYPHNIPVRLLPGETAALDCNPTTDDLQDMCHYMQRCEVPSSAHGYIKIAAGGHTLVDQFVDLIQPGNMVDIRPAVAATTYTIAAGGIAFFAVAGTQYRCRITVASPFFAAGTVAVGMPIGIKNAQGDNDAALASGAHIITDVHASGTPNWIEFIINSPYAPVDPTALDFTLNWSTPANTIYVPNCWIMATAGSAPNWDGSSREGFFNLDNGARLSMRSVALAYAGSAGTEHDLIMVRGMGSRLDLYEHCIIVGAGDKVLRGYGMCEIHANQSMIGGQTDAQELFNAASGVVAQFIRCSLCSATVAGVTVGAGCFVTFTQGVLASTPVGGRVTDGGTLDIVTSRIIHHTRGLYAVNGRINIDSAAGVSSLFVERNTTGLDWLAQGEIVGDCVMGAGTQANVADSEAARNVPKDGSGWRASLLYGVGISEMGSNANGQWIKFSNGQMMCRRADIGNLICTTASGAGFTAAAGLTWTFPVAFTAAPQVSANCPESASRWCNAYTVTTTNCIVINFGFVSDGSSRNVAAVAWGSWY